jgi:AraC family transcriptional regulator
MDFDIRYQLPATVACVSHTGFFSGIAEAFGRLFQGLGSPGLSCASRLLTVFHDDPAAEPSRQRADAAIELGSGRPEPSCALEIRNLPGGAYAVMLHTGPYAGLPSAWIGFSAELAKRGLRPLRSLRFEIYLNDPEEVPENELQTELHLPIDQAL